MARITVNIKIPAVATDKASNCDVKRSVGLINIQCSVSYHLSIIIIILFFMLSFKKAKPGWRHLESWLQGFFLCASYLVFTWLQAWEMKIINPCLFSCWRFWLTASVSFEKKMSKKFLEFPALLFVFLIMLFS